MPELTEKKSVGDHLRENLVMLIAVAILGGGTGTVSGIVSGGNRAPAEIPDRFTGAQGRALERRIDLIETWRDNVLPLELQIAFLSKAEVEAQIELLSMEIDELRNELRRSQ